MTDRIIAMGDVHGCSKALATLIEAIQPTQQDTLVFLGDYIDRGPDSRGVVEQVIALGERCTVVPLLGNHEEMLLAALEGQSELDFWMKFGGMAALTSYGWKGGPDVFFCTSPGAKKSLEGLLPEINRRAGCWGVGGKNPAQPLAWWGMVDGIPVGLGIHATVRQVILNRGRSERRASIPACLE